MKRYRAKWQAVIGREWKEANEEVYLCTEVDGLLDRCEGALEYANDYMRQGEVECPDIRDALAALRAARGKWWTTSLEGSTCMS